VREAEAGATLIETASAGMLRTGPCPGARSGDVVFLALRPEKVRIALEAPPPGENCVAGRVCNIGYLGDLSIYKVRLDTGFVMKAALANVTRVVERPIGSDARVWLAWSPQVAVVLTR